MELLSHRAAYRLSLARSDPASGISEVQGGLVLEWRAGCEGSLSQQRLGFVALTEDGPDVTYDVRFSSWESPDGTQLRFTMRSFDGDKLFEEFRGTAALEAPGAAGLVRYDIPGEKDIDLPSGTIFPTAHVQQLIEAARAGRQLVTHSVFDGAGPEALSKVTAVIAPARQVTAEGAAPETRWPMSLAYYNAAEPDALPEFEIAFALGERGVLHDVTLDYGDFELDRRDGEAGDLGAPGLPVRAHRAASRPSQAAPRTPVLSPCAGGFSWVRTWSENT